MDILSRRQSTCQAIAGHRDAEMSPVAGTTVICVPEERKQEKKAEASVYRALYALLRGLEILLKKVAVRSIDQESEIIGFVFRFWSGGWNRRMRDR